MNRFVTLAALVAVVGSLGAPASAATMMKASPKPMASAMSSSMMSSSMTCPKGQTYTKGYKKKNGTMVKGYCHK